LKGKVALVTAASRGLGRAVATELARESAQVVIASRSKEALGRTAAEIRKQTGVEVGYYVANLSAEGDLKALVSHIADRFGGVDILINNVGGPPAGGFDDFGDEAWREAFESILMSVIRAVREVLPHMRRVGGGGIVNIASYSMKQSIENLILSNTFRAGLAGLAKSLSVELAPEGILINTLGPGYISTKRSAYINEVRAQAQGVPVEEIRRQVEGQIPLGRYGTPEEFAKVAAFLASPANGYVTGQAILVDGGMVKAL
jgi:3-oxoacyl-[acyl-carrier protein] reductase